MGGMIMKRILFAALLGIVAVPAMAQQHRQAIAVTPKTTVTAVSNLAVTGSVTIKVVNPQVNTLSSLTCTTLDADGSSCDAVPNVALGFAIASFTITGSPIPYTGTPTLTDPSGNFKISGGTIVPTKTPIAAGTYTLTINP